MNQKSAFIVEVDDILSDFAFSWRSAIKKN